MLVEKIELTMSHVSLGNLNEYALMVLFGDAHSHHLTLGLDSNPSEIVDQEGHILYPAYFVTKLNVPEKSPLANFKLWDKVDVAVDVKRFGDTLLESNYVIGPQGTVPDNIDQWNQDTFPTMLGNNLIIIDTIEGETTSNRRVANPRSDSIAKLEKTRKVPEGISLSKRVRMEGIEIDACDAMLTHKDPISYFVVPGRDTSPGHAMIFAKFSEIMDYAEFTFLSEMITPKMPTDLLSNLSILERETYYYGNCFGGEELTIFLSGSIEMRSCDQINEVSNTIAAANLNFVFEIYKRKDSSLVSISKVKKLLSIPVKNQDLIQDVCRIVPQL